MTYPAPKNPCPHGGYGHVIYCGACESEPEAKGEAVEECDNTKTDREVASLRAAVRYAEVREEVLARSLAEVSAENAELRELVQDVIDVLSLKTVAIARGSFRDWLAKAKRVLRGKR